MVNNYHVEGLVKRHLLLENGITHFRDVGISLWEIKDLPLGARGKLGHPNVWAHEMCMFYNVGLQSCVLNIMH